MTTPTVNLYVNKSEVESKQPFKVSWNASGGLVTEKSSIKIYTAGKASLLFDRSINTSVGTGSFVVPFGFSDLPVGYEVYLETSSRKQRLAFTQVGGLASVSHYKSTGTGSGRGTGVSRGTGNPLNSDATTTFWTWVLVFVVLLLVMVVAGYWYMYPKTSASNVSPVGPRSVVRSSRA